MRTGSPRTTRRATAWLTPVLLVFSTVVVSLGGLAPPASAASSDQVTLHRSGCPADGSTDNQGTATFTLETDGTLHVSGEVTGGLVDNSYQARLFTECGSWAYTDGTLSVDSSGHATFSFYVPPGTFPAGTHVGLQLVNPPSATTPPYTDLLTTDLTWAVPDTPPLLDTNLIRNGDAEQGDASANGSPVPVPGWDIHGTNFAVVA